MDFKKKKNKLIELIEKYIENKDFEKELLEYVNELKNDYDFGTKELFKKIFEEIEKYLPDLTRKELKQRILMIKDYEE
jgi:predicted transcriptional regulator